MAEEGTIVTRRLESLGRFAAHHRRTVAVVSLVVLLAAGGVAASTVQLDMGVGLYIEDDSATAENWAVVESGYDRGNAVFVVLEAADVTDPETVRLVDRLDERYTGLDRISNARSLADVVRLGAGGTIPDTRTDVELAIERVRGGSNATGTLVETLYPESGKTVLVLSYGDVAPPAEAGGALDFVVTKDAEVIEEDVRRATDEVALPAGASITITGASIFQTAAFELMLLDALALFAGGFAVVFLVVYLVMRRRLESGWQAFFSLGVAFAAVVVMLGAMGVLGYNFNAIMLSVLPVGLGLSVDYALQIQTRYAEERDEGRPPTDAAGIAARTTGRTLVLAMGTTVVGFGSLLASPVPPVRQFGVTVAINVVAAMVLSVTLLVALLVTADVRRGASVSRRGRADGLLERVLGAVGRAAKAHPFAILLVLLPALAGGAAAYPHIDTTQEMLDYWPQDLEERQQFEETIDTAPSPKTVYVVVETADAYAPATIRAVGDFQRQVAALPHVNGVGGPITGLRAATGGEIPESEDRIRRLLEDDAGNPLSSTAPPSSHPNRLLLTLHVDNVEGAEIRTLVDRVERAAAETLPDERVFVTGKPVLTRTIIENVTAGLERMTALSFAAAFLFLLVALRSPRDSLVLLLTVPATAATLVLGAMFLLEIPWNPGTVSMASIALGVGVDYGLHIHERYDEERAGGTAPPAAMAETMRSLSRPVFGSGLTTIAGFGVLVFSQFPVVRNFGKTLVLVVAFSMFSAFVALPTVVIALDATSPRSIRRALPVVGEGSMARNGRVLADPGAFAGDPALASSLEAGERLEYVLETEGGGLVHEGPDGIDRYSPGRGRAIAAVTDRRILFVVETTDPVGVHVTGLPYPSVWSVEASTGMRTSRLWVTTQDGHVYGYRMGGRHDLEAVVGYVDGRAERWREATRHLDAAEAALASTVAEPVSGTDAYDRVREHLSAAGQIADAGPLAEQLETLERRLTAARIADSYARGEAQRLDAEARREAGDYERAHEAYTIALDAYTEAVEIAEEAGVGDVAEIADRRDRVRERLSSLEAEPLRWASVARERAVEADEPEAAVAAWTETVEWLRTALDLAWGDSPFEGDLDRLRFDVEWAAANCIEAHRRRAHEAEDAGDDREVDPGGRREAYRTALEHFRAARELAGELRAGDVDAIDTDVDRIESKLGATDLRDTATEERDLPPWRRRSG